MTLYPMGAHLESNEDGSVVIKRGSTVLTPKLFSRDIVVHAIGHLECQRKLNPGEAAFLETQLFSHTFPSRNT